MYYAVVNIIQYRTNVYRSFRFKHVHKWEQNNKKQNKTQKTNNHNTLSLQMFGPVP